MFQPVRIDVQCGRRPIQSIETRHLMLWAVLFFRTRAPVEPVAFVHSICSDALTSANSIKSRRIKRLTPMTLMGKANEKGLEDVLKVVLDPHFHTEGVKPQKVRSQTSQSTHFAAWCRSLQGPNSKTSVILVRAPRTAFLGRTRCILCRWRVSKY